MSQASLYCGLTIMVYSFDGQERFHLGYLLQGFKYCRHSLHTIDSSVISKFATPLLLVKLFPIGPNEIGLFSS